KEQAFLDTCRLYEQRYGEQYCSSPVTISEESSHRALAGYARSSVSGREWTSPIYSYWDQTHFEFDNTTNYENPFSFVEADVILDGNWLLFCNQFMAESLSKLAIRADHSSIDLKLPALKRLKKSYERFLYMAAKFPSKNEDDFVHPTYAIDIIWHAHMQEPLHYAADSIRLVGYVMDHAPWPLTDDYKT
ncbi:unnamed protein product, partial [Didymodactylos carnosus]